MVEITYQMVLSTLQTIALIVGIAYYLFIMRNSQRNQQMQLETRQAELYMRLWEKWNTKEFSEQRYEVYRMEWTDFDDFNEKYSGRSNPETFASWNTFGRMITGLAELRRKRLIDVEFLDIMMINDIMNWWAKCGSLEKESWEKGVPNWRSHFPFIKEVIEYDRRLRPFRYDENGDRMSLRPGRTWVRPEDMDPSILQRK